MRRSTHLWSKQISPRTDIIIGHNTLLLLRKDSRRRTFPTPFSPLSQLLHPQLAVPEDDLIRAESRRLILVHLITAFCKPLCGEHMQFLPIIMAKLVCVLPAHDGGGYLDVDGGIGKAVSAQREQTGEEA